MRILKGMLLRRGGKKYYKVKLKNIHYFFMKQMCLIYNYLGRCHKMSTAIYANIYQFLMTADEKQNLDEKGESRNK